MTIILTAAQSACYDEGGFAAWRIEEDIVERCWREDITEPVLVTLATGTVLFAVTKGVRTDMYGRQT